VKTTKLAAFARNPAWILGSQAYDPTPNASFIMNKVELVEAVQKQLGGETSKAEAERAVTAVINAVKVGVKKDKLVQLVGFGTFKVVERKARKGVNPKTLQQIRIPKSKTVKFVPGKDFKSKV
jgi:DNA-binding protein HU-beta